jgi:hypothetical protein
LSVLSVVYTTKNRVRIAGTIVFAVGIPSGDGDRYQLGIELAGHVCNWPVSSVPVVQQFGSDRSESGHSADIVDRLKMTLVV